MENIDFHPLYLAQAEALADEDPLVFEDVQLLVNALETHGHSIEGDNHTADPSHPIVTSRYDLWALRRTPPTGFTPEANTPPILRIPYVWIADTRNRTEYPLVLLIGDKTNNQQNWYPAVVNKIENNLIPEWEQAHPGHSAKTKRRTAP